MTTWGDLVDIVTGDEITYSHKMNQITTILEHFPERQFILIGDSGQYDPELYRDIRSYYPGQIKQIFIRDIVNAREENPDRLKGMDIISADNILNGVSLFD
ncbi:MAG: App1 family protein [Balneolaceae bacterium]|nr:App1 family protein [Balneolaceae bacterium]